MLSDPRRQLFKLELELQHKQSLANRELQLSYSAFRFRLFIQYLRALEQF